MKKNMGIIDRLIRIVVVAVIGVLYFTGKIDGTLGTIILVVGCVMLLTSVLGVCPMYNPLGIKTNKDKA